MIWRHHHLNLVFAAPKQREAEMWEGDAQHRKQKVLVATDYMI